MLPVTAAGVADVIGHASLVVYQRRSTALEAAAARSARGAAERGEEYPMDARQVIIEPVVSEKSYALMADGKYTFRVDERAHKTQIRRAVEEIFDVGVVEVRTIKMRSKPKRRGLHSGRTRSWKKAIVELAPGRPDRAVRGRRGGGVSRRSRGRTEKTMAMRKTKPTSPGRRFATYQKRDEVVPRTSLTSR